MKMNRFNPWTLSLIIVGCLAASVLLGGVLMDGLTGVATANTEPVPELPQAEVIYRINAGKVYKIKVDGVEYLIIPGSIIRHDPK